MQERTAKKTKITQRILTVIGIVLCVIFGFFLICNMTIIIKGSLEPEKPPAIFGTTPMVVLSGSMSGTAKDHIEAGDLIFVEKANEKELKIGDIIAFTEENSHTVVTHRIIEIKTAEDGSPLFVTKGDANNIEDKNPVAVQRLVGIFKFRVAGVGNFAIFLQTPMGMLLFIGIPLLAFIIYDIIRRQYYANKEKKNAKELETELEKLRAQVGEQDK